MGKKSKLRRSRAKRKLYKKLLKAAYVMPQYNMGPPENVVISKLETHAVFEADRCCWCGGLLEPTWINGRQNKGPRAKTKEHLIAVPTIRGLSSAHSNQARLKKMNLVVSSCQDCNHSRNSSLGPPCKNNMNISSLPGWASVAWRQGMAHWITAGVMFCYAQYKKPKPKMIRPVVELDSSIFYETKIMFEQALPCHDYKSSRRFRNCSNSPHKHEICS